MKKLLILILCATFLLGWSLYTHANETNKLGEWKTCDFNNNWRTDIDDVTRFIDHCYLGQWEDSNKCDLNNNEKSDIEDTTLFTDVCINKELLWKKSDKEQTEAYDSEACDLNNDKEINIADINRFNVHCSVINWRDSNKCDFNNDKEFNIADINKFNYLCYGEILGTNSKKVDSQDWKTCDFDEDWKINIADVTRFIDYCYLGQWENTNKCDINGNGKFDIEDITQFNEICIYKELLWKSSSNTNQNTNNWKTCDINNDTEIDINDVTRFIDNCTIWEWKGTNKCDIDWNWKFNQNDITQFNNKCYNKILWTNEKLKYDEDDSDNYKKEEYKNEKEKAYEFAYENWITTKKNIESANMNWSLNRIEMAKMLSEFSINVLWKEPNTSKWTIKFSDVTDKLNKQYWNAVTKSYQLWIMWQNLKNNKFRPYDKVTRAEFATALSRLLYNTKDWKWSTKYYEPHIKLLNQNWILKDTTSPKRTITRWNAMIMLMRAVD